MSNTNAHMTEVDSGSAPTKQSTPAMPMLRPWEIAELPLFRFRNQQVVDVEHASDQQFEAWRKQNGIPVEENGVVDWPFELRCKVINHCRFYGAWSALKFPIDFSAERDTEELTAPNSADSEQNSADAQNQEGA